MPMLFIDRVSLKFSSSVAPWIRSSKDLQLGLKAIAWIACCVVNSVFLTYNILYRVDLYVSTRCEDVFTFVIL